MMKMIKMSLELNKIYEILKKKKKRKKNIFIYNSKIKRTINKKIVNI